MGSAFNHTHSHRRRRQAPPLAAKQMIDAIVTGYPLAANSLVAIPADCCVFFVLVLAIVGFLWQQQAISPVIIIIFNTGVDKSSFKQGGGALRGKGACNGILSKDRGSCGKASRLSPARQK